MNKPSRFLAVTISLALTASTMPWSAMAAPMAGPAFVQTFTPPTRLGYVVDQFQGTSAQPIVLIQDLHANVKVQKKIVGLLSTFKNALTPNGRPMIMGREAAWKEVDLSALTSKPELERKARTEALLNRAYISAQEYYAVMNPDVPSKILGIENEADYKLHQKLTQASFMARMKLAGKLEILQTAIEAKKAEAPSDLKKIWSAEEKYLKGEIGLDQLARRLHLPSLTYSETEKALLDRKMELASKAKKDATTLKNTVLADHYLSLLTRLFRQQMTLEEVQFAYRNATEILSVVKALMPKEDVTEWANVLRGAVDYYAVALVRDEPLAENSMKIASQNPDQPIVVVAGGFHAEGMTKHFRSKGVSYVVLAPVVESHTLNDELLYMSRILGLDTDNAQFSKDLKAATKMYTLAPEAKPEAEPNKPKTNPDGTPNNWMAIADENAPLLTSIPTTGISVDAGLQEILTEAITTARGFGLRMPTDAKIVIADSKMAETTFKDANGQFTVVFAAAELKKLAELKQSNPAAYASKSTAFVFGAVNKAIANIETDNQGELGSTSLAFSNIFRSLSLDAIQQVYADTNGSPMSVAILSIAKVMGDSGVKTVDDQTAQTKWLNDNAGTVNLIIAAVMKSISDKTGIEYADSKTVIKTLASDQSLIQTLAGIATLKGFTAKQQVEKQLEKLSGFLSGLKPDQSQEERIALAAKEAFALSA